MFTLSDPACLLIPVVLHGPFPTAARSMHGPAAQCIPPRFHPWACTPWAVLPRLRYDTFRLLHALRLRSPGLRKWAATFTVRVPVAIKVARRVSLKGR